MGFTKGRELAIFILVETILHRQFENRDGPAKHQRTYMLVSDEADAFDGMDRKAAEIALYEMGVRGKWWLLESNMTRETRSEGDGSRPTLAPLQKVRGGGTGGSPHPNEVQCSEVVPTGEVGKHGLGGDGRGPVCDGSQLEWFFY